MYIHCTKLVLWVLILKKNTLYYTYCCTFIITDLSMNRLYVSCIRKKKERKEEQTYKTLKTTKPTQKEKGLLSKTKMSCTFTA